MTAVLLSAILLLAKTPKLPAKVNEACASGKEGAKIVHIHGRLGVYNGGYPNLRLWHVGTHHLFGIYGDQADLKCERGGDCNSDEDTKMPSNVDALLKLPNPLFRFVIFGDFELRLLEPGTSGHMQAACIVSADRLVRLQSD
jgi:hypothetical protein